MMILNVWFKSCYLKTRSSVILHEGLTPRDWNFDIILKKTCLENWLLRKVTEKLNTLSSSVNRSKYDCKQGGL